MAGGGGGGGDGEGPRELDQTPTWAVSTVCGVIILISIILELMLHKIGTVKSLKRSPANLHFFLHITTPSHIHWIVVSQMFERKKKKALFEALLKIKTGTVILKEIRKP